MTSLPSWDRHWGRNKGPLSADKGDAVIFSFKESSEWYAAWNAAVLYEGISSDLDECKSFSFGNTLSSMHNTAQRFAHKELLEVGDDLPVSHFRIDFTLY